jgi:hypothetical protein
MTARMTTPTATSVLLLVGSLYPGSNPRPPLTRRLLALHYRFLNRRVDLPLHPSWASWLRERGLQANEVEALKSMGVHAHRCQPDALSQKLDTTYELRDENDGSP